MDLAIAMQMRNAKSDSIANANEREALSHARRDAQASQVTQRTR